MYCTELLGDARCQRWSGHAGGHTTSVAQAMRLDWEDMKKTSALAAGGPAVETTHDIELPPLELSVEVGLIDRRVLAWIIARNDARLDREITCDARTREWMKGLQDDFELLLIAFGLELVSVTG